MKAVIFHVAGGPETLTVDEISAPKPAANEVLIRVVGAGLNRADVLQRKGQYNLPPGASDIFGLEVSGTIAEVGSDVSNYAPGDEVMALLASGGYAEFVAVDAGHVTPIPNNVPLLEAGGIPEAAATLVSNLCIVGRFAAGETVLIHGATGGIGAFGIQLVKALGGRVAVTASSDTKLAHARELGADVLINYKTEDFVQRMREVGGADIILDTVGGPYLPRNIEALALHGRIVTIGLQGGGESVVDLSQLMKKKASITGTLLRDRTAAEKTQIMSEVRKIVIPLIEAGAITSKTDRIFPLSRVAEAHSYFDQKVHVGKILLDCRSES